MQSPSHEYPNDTRKTHADRPQISEIVDFFYQIADAGQE